MSTAHSNASKLDRASLVLAAHIQLFGMEATMPATGWWKRTHLPSSDIEIAKDALPFCKCRLLPTSKTVSIRLRIVRHIPSDMILDVLEADNNDRSIASMWISKYQMPDAAMIATSLEAHCASPLAKLQDNLFQAWRSMHGLDDDEEMLLDQLHAAGERVLRAQLHLDPFTHNRIPFLSTTVHEVVKVSDDTAVRFTRAEYWLKGETNGPADLYDWALAKCLRDMGYKMYGAKDTITHLFLRDPTRGARPISRPIYVGIARTFDLPDDASELSNELPSSRDFVAFLPLMDQRVLINDRNNERGLRPWHFGITRSVELITCVWNESRKVSQYLIPEPSTSVGNIAY